MKDKIKRTYRITRYVVYRQTIIEPIDHLWTFFGAFIGIAAIGLIANLLVRPVHSDHHVKEP